MNFTQAMAHALEQRVGYMIAITYDIDNAIQALTYEEAAQYARDDGNTELACFLGAAYELMECMSALDEELNYGS